VIHQDTEARDGDCNAVDRPAERLNRLIDPQAVGACGVAELPMCQ
jgi:hypothetical protein